MVNEIHAQHEFQFTQYNLIPAIYNPGATGARGLSTINLNHREQWIGLEGAPSQTYLGYENYLQKSKLGIGISYTQDQVGPVDDGALNINLAYHLEISENYALSLGLKGTAEFWNLNLFDINTYQDDPALYGEDTQQFFPNIGAGIWLYSEKITAGISVPYFIRNTYNGSGEDATKQEEIHIYYNFSYIFPISDNIQLQPSMLVRQINNAPTTADFWINGLFYNQFKTGIMYRTSETFAIMAGIQVTKKIYLGYSYDQQTTDVNSTNTGSHEFSFRFDLSDLKTKKIKQSQFF